MRSIASCKRIINDYDAAERNLGDDSEQRIPCTFFDTLRSLDYRLSFRYIYFL